MQPSNLIRKLQDLHYETRRANNSKMIKQQRQQNLIQAEKHNMQKFLQMNANMTESSLIENLRTYYAYSSANDYNFMMLSHCSLIQEALQTCQKEEVGLMLLEMLINLAQYEEFEISEDSGTAKMLCRWATRFPSEVTELLMLLGDNKTKYPCDLLFSRVVEEGIAEILEKQECLPELLCMIVRTRPILKIEILEYLLVKIHKFQMESEHLSMTLVKFNDLREYDYLASLLCKLFLEQSLKLHQIVPFYRYLCRHEQLIVHVISIVKDKLRQELGKHPQQVLSLLTYVCRKKEMTFLDIYDGSFISEIANFDTQQVFEMFEMAIVRPQFNQKIMLNSQHREHFLYFINHNLGGLLRDRVQHTLYLIVLLADRSEHRVLVDWMRQRLQYLINHWPVTKQSKLHEYCEILLH